MDSSSNLEAYYEAFADLLEQAPFSLSKEQKHDRLNQLIELLHHYHLQHCAQYQDIASAMQTSELGNTKDKHSLSEQLFIAVRLFKLFELSSIEQADIFKVLSSSGTTGQAPARILLDKETSIRQSKTLVNIMQDFIGKQRLPMLIIDTESVARGRSGFSARTAGIQGMSFFGRKHVYALNEDMTPNWSAIDSFFADNSAAPVSVFGFTFMVWQYFIQAAIAAKKSYVSHRAILIHSGGWKKLESEKVDNAQFKNMFSKVVSNSQIHNFYGMAEQVGSIFVECEHGVLHAPNMADVIIRKCDSLAPAKPGEKGLIQVLSALPTSYPGHNILTEDLGRQLGEDDCACGRKGKYFEVLGRLPKAEIRGCSDTHEQ